MSCAIVISSIITALATLAIAAYARYSYKLTKELQISSNKHQQEISDLYQAIVISTLFSGPAGEGAYDEAVNRFKKTYKGKTKIF